MTLLGNTKENYKATVELCDKKNSEYNLHLGEQKKKFKSSMLLVLISPFIQTRKNTLRNFSKKNKALGPTMSLC